MLMIITGLGLSFGMSQALEMIVNKRRNTMVMYGQPTPSRYWHIPGKES